MPTYEYACAKCGHHWEEVQKISEPPVQTCPSCKKKSAQRQISGGSFILKGGGWYADAYSSPKPSSKEGNGASKSESKEAQSESKDGKRDSKDSKGESKKETPASGGKEGSSAAPTSSTSKPETKSKPDKS
jgi:putative FmdB family regulatory protein